MIKSEKNYNRNNYEYGNEVAGKVLSTDSYIEEVFYNKCIAKSVRNKLLLEWIDSKSIYISYTDLIKGDFGNYSRHDASHSVTILNAITSILGRERIDNLNATDLWMLLHVAYGHDFGMPYTYDEMTEFWKKLKENDSEFSNFFYEAFNSDDEDLKNAASLIDEISGRIGMGKFKTESTTLLDECWMTKVHRSVLYLTMEYVRRKHAQRSMKSLENCGVIKDIGTSKIDRRFYKIIGKCFYMHGTYSYDEIMNMDKEEWDIESQKCHPRFIAFMLRIGDLLDLCEDRYDLVALKHYGKLPDISELNKKKHEAIEHVLYSTEKIEIVAKASDEKVCKIIDAWFKYIHEEVNYLIAHWSEIVPSELGGCTMAEPCTEVYLNNVLYNSIEEREFHVNKDLLINLVIGRNLYKTQFDFLREYIQNALDATKMKFWIELENSNLDLYIRDDSIQYEKNALLPFDFRDIAFIQYAIDIKVKNKMVKDSASGINKDYIHFEIIDRGIGIDKECISAISHIGAGWKRRKKYGSQLDRMPKWLRPTGGFGIGMQSGFMITDKITIETMSEIEKSGTCITLLSNNNDGRIEVKNIDKRDHGTKIELDIPFEWFSDLDNYRDYDYLANLNTGEKDFMDPLSMSELVSNFIETYTRTVIGNPLFPIRLQVENNRPVEINGFWHYDCNNIEQYPCNGKRYLIYNGIDLDGSITIWNMEKNILCKSYIDNRQYDGNARTVKWYFKGVTVDENSFDDEKKNLFRYIGRCSIDLMGYDVNDCLTVDRSCFSQDFVYSDIANSFAEVLLNYMVDKDLLLKENYTGMDILRTLVAYNLVDKEKISKLRESVDVILEKNHVSANNDEYILVSNYDIEKQKIILNEKPDKFEELLKKILFEKKRVYFTIEENKNIIVKSYDQIAIEKVWLLCESEKINVLARLIADYFSLMGENKATKIGDTLVSCFPPFKYVKNKSDEKLRLIENTRTIFPLKDNQFEKLWVDKIPFMKKEISDVAKSDVESHLVISPIPAVYNTNAIVERLSNKKSPDKEFVKMIINHATYDKLINWVINNQWTKGKYNYDDINNEYLELINIIYEKDIEPLIKEARKHEG